jgi:streptogramin lyase
MLRVALVLLLAVSLATSVGAQPAFEKLGSFVGRGGAMSTLVGPGPGGTERLYVCYTYISSLDLVASEPDTGKFKVWRSPEGGAWAMENGPDGRIYLGTYFQGHILRLDPENGKLDDLGQAIPGETYIWQLSLGPDGYLYGCTYPGAKLLRVDPKTGAMTDLGRMDPDQNYNRTLCAAPDGWVYCAIGSEKANLAAYNTKTREVRALIPAAERGPGFGQVIRGADGKAYGTCLGKSYRLRDGAATPIDSLPAAMARQKLKDGRSVDDPRTYPGRDLPIFRLAAGPDGNVYGSSILPEYLLHFDPASPKPVTMGLIPGAEAYSMLSAHGKLFIASYTGATLQVYDPAQPFKPGTTRANNPSYYGSTAPEQDRPYDIALGEDGRVYMACVPAYGHFGGALSWYDPATDAVDHVPTPVKDQAIASVCALPGGLLACGTSIEGGPGTKPRATEAVLFLWDPARKEKVFECVPVPGSSIIVNLTAGKDGLVYGSAGKSLFAFDPRKRMVVGRTALAEGSVVRAGLLTLADGRVVALAGATANFVRFANRRWQVRAFARCDAPLTVGKAIVGDYLYAASDKELVRCKIPRGR